MRLLRWMCFALCLFLAAGVHAQDVRAWLDRDRIEAGETATLTIAAENLNAAPDYGPLQRDFELSGHSSQRSATRCGIDSPARSR